MNDYLANLITRSLSQEEVILPRPSSLYETAVPTTDVTPLEEESIVDAQPKAAAPAPPTPVAAWPTVEPTPEPGPVKHAPEIQQTPITPQIPPLLSWLEQLKTFTQQPSATARPINPIEDESNIRPTPKAVLSQPSPTITTPHKPVPTAAPEPPKAKSQVEPKPQEIIERQFSTTKLVERVEQTPVISETITEREKVPAAMPTSSATPSKTDRQPVQPAQQKIIVAETRPYQPSIPTAPTREQAEPTPPAIHVTIGRVEVRATKPPPAVPTRRSRHTNSTVMSLDDYLRQRANGEKK